LRAESAGATVTDGRVLGNVVGLCTDPASLVQTIDTRFKGNEHEIVVSDDCLGAP
jgi:hypothetical protein